MSQYEFIFLLNEKEELKKLKELIVSISGKLTEEKSWGKKTLSYSIKKNSSADFYEWKLELTPSKISELKKKLSFNEKLIRYLLLKKEN
ncbi:30S ribosomal protein S6 [Candidatus Roizmanbacteria bacterium]|nr:30S ribosomal protein S6 [Candidatus Roizmanbacteria bacterium]